MTDPATETPRKTVEAHRRRPPVAVNLATALLVIATSVNLVFVVPALMTDLVNERTTGPLGTAATLLTAMQVAVILAVLILSVLARRGRRPAWLILVGLLVFDGLLVFGAATARIWSWTGSDHQVSPADLTPALASVGMTVVFVALLVAPRSSRGYFRTPD